MEHAQAPPVSARDVALDDGDLARRARTTLAGADRGALLLNGPYRLGGNGVPVPVADDEGEPLIVCQRDGALARTARARRLAGLILAPTPEHGVGLTLVGRLLAVDDMDPAVRDRSYSAARRIPLKPEAHELLTLRVEHVRVTCPHASRLRLTTTGMNVPLGRYVDAEPDLVAANIPRIRRHLNVDHAEHLRHLAAHAAGITVADVLSASLGSLRADGLTLDVIDTWGMRPRVIRFRRRAESVEELAAMLRACVEHASREA